MSRGLAFIVDALLLVGGLGVVLASVGLTGMVLGWAATDLVRGLTAAFATTLPALWLGLNAVMWTATGRTPGKALLGLRVVCVDGAPIRLGRALVRALGYLASAILLAGFVWVLADRHRQAWHDKLAGTVVVYDSGRRAVAPHRVGTGEIIHHG